MNFIKSGMLPFDVSLANARAAALIEASRMGVSSEDVFGRRAIAYAVGRVAKRMVMLPRA
jgi:hypothetical protein